MKMRKDFPNEYYGRQEERHVQQAMPQQPIADHQYQQQQQLQNRLLEEERERADQEPEEDVIQIPLTLRNKYRSIFSNVLKQKQRIARISNRINGT